jgi:uncharacterized membrane protein YhaH (DUF805 family)
MRQGLRVEFAVTATIRRHILEGYMDWGYLFTSFEGRINRAKFWAGILVLLVIGLIAIAIDNFVLGITFSPEIPYGYVYALFGLASIYFGLALYTKRWHDRDKSGWWTLIILVPVIGGIWFLVELGILEGTRGANRFGPDPLG